MNILLLIIIIITIIAFLTIICVSRWIHRRWPVVGLAEQAVVIDVAAASELYTIGCVSSLLAGHTVID